MKMCKKGQGATEYLLMLAAVLVIVAIAVYYVSSAAPSAIIAGTAENIGDNVSFTPSSSMTPENIAATDWEYALYDSGGTKIVDYTAGPDALARGTPVVLGAGNETMAAATSGYILKIRYKGGSVTDVTIA
jgi:hypothetical protein